MVTFSRNQRKHWKGLEQHQSWFCVFSLSGEGTEQLKAARVGQHDNLTASNENQLFTLCSSWMHRMAFVLAEVSPARDNKMRCLSENGVSSGENGGWWTHLPQKLLRLFSLQHQAEVSCCTWIYCYIYSCMIIEKISPDAWMCFASQSLKFCSSSCSATLFPST